MRRFPIPVSGGGADIFGLLLSLYIWALVIGAVLSWLAAFDAVNTRNRFVQVAGDFIYRITDPALRPIRRVIPPLGGVDLSAARAYLPLMLFNRSFITFCPLDRPRALSTARPWRPE